MSRAEGPRVSERPVGRAVRRLLASSLLAVVLVVALHAAPARADGDPASDVLLSAVAFLPADGGFPAAEQTHLTALLAAAARAGQPIRVAVMPDSYDLGAITALWGRPQTYARFLGIELSLVYKHPLVVVMPDGVGLNWPGRAGASTRRLVAALPRAPGRGGLLAAADAAVSRVLVAAHVHVGAVASTGPGASTGTAARARAPAPTRHATHRTGTGVSGATVILAVVAGLVDLVALALIARRLAPRLRGVRGSAPRASGAPGDPTPRSPAAPGWWPAWALPTLLATLSTAILAQLVVRPLAAPSAAQGEARVRAGTPYTLPAGARRAPDFTLRDQHGRPVSLAGLRGRPVLLTFADPVCRNLCPLEAHVLNALVRELPAARRPAIVAVSVDPFADARHNLLQDVGRWGLVPQWHWGVGSHAQLAAVWRRYAINVNTVTRRIAGTAVHIIYHDEESYLIDPAGYERALFSWPFSSQDVLATLRRMSRS